MFFSCHLSFFYINFFFYFHLLHQNVVLKNRRFKIRFARKAPSMVGRRRLEVGKECLGGILINSNLQKKRSLILNL